MIAADPSLRHETRAGHSCLADSREAVREFHASVAQPEMGLVIFFCSARYDLKVLGSEIARVFGDTPVIGCTAAGEFGPAGYGMYSLAGASFAKGAFTAVTGCLPELQQFSLKQGETFASALLRRLEAAEPGAGRADTFGFLLIDGLSIREEPVTHVLQHALGGIPLVGGSAADDLSFKGTFVYHQGHFHPDSAVLALISTPLPFKVFKTQHFIPSAQRLVVTSADPAHRLVHEINGLPAAEEYARIMALIRPT